MLITLQGVSTVYPSVIRLRITFSLATVQRKLLYIRNTLK
jgi:hypothetical protein